MKIATFGVCHAAVIASCLEVMLPDATVISVSHGSAKQDLGVLKELSDVDLVVTGDGSAAKIVSRYLSEQNLPTPHLQYPTFFFTGFHPDIIYSLMNETRGPFSSTHSAIAVQAFLSGLGVCEAQSLYNDKTYAFLGYYDHWAAATETLARQADRCGAPIRRLVDEWPGRGVFMHNPQHPKLEVLADIARAVCERAGLTPTIRYPESYMADPLLSGAWAVYPEIADRLNVKGEYCFSRMARTAQRELKLETLGLQQFLEKSFAFYETLPREALAVERLKDPRYAEIASFATGRPVAARTGPGSVNPYKALPDFHFWRRSVSSVAPHDLDPVVSPKVRFDRRDRIATAGSCFAQNVARWLKTSGFKYYISETPPDGLSAEERLRRNYGVYSARFGNLYTTRQLLQTFERAFGGHPSTGFAWRRADDRYVDPYRPEIEPDGFASKKDLETSRKEHLAAVRTMFETLDVFVFTLGLTEAWERVSDGAVVPLAPGVAGADALTDAFRFVNFGAEEARADLEAFWRGLKRVNPRARMILTVSPVPLIATFERRHVLTATTYSKSVLRIVADEVSRTDPDIDYFPSYEIVTGPLTRGQYFGADSRSVTEAGVAHVMRVFLSHHSVEAGAPAGHDLSAEFEAGRALICEEELLDRARGA